MFLNVSGAADGMESLNKNITLADINFKKLGETITQSLNPISTINKSFEIQQLTAKAVRTTMGLTTDVSKELDKVMVNVTKNTLEFGVGVEENIKLFSELNTQMSRNTFLTETQVENMQAFAKATGLSAAEVVTMIVGFDSIGVGITNALEQMSKIRKTAISFGLNVNTMMDTVAKNVKLVTAFNFKGGIDGFTKMVAKAQALRIDFTKTINLADSLMDPEKAIELAAGMQMLGGSVGDLADPFRVLFLAQNDVVGLQDELLKAAQSAVVFNKKTGDFDIPVTEMYRLREMAKLTGKSYQELADEAIKSARRTKNLEFLEMENISDDNKELLASLGTLKDGTLEFAMPDGTIKKLEDVIKNDDLLQVLKDMGLSDKDIAIRQLTAIENMATQIERTGFLTTKAAIVSPEFQTSIEKMLSDFNSGIGKVNEQLETSTNTYVSGISSVLNQVYPPQFFKSTGMIINSGLNALNTNIQNLVTQIQTLNTKFKLTPETKANDFVSFPSSQRMLTSSEGSVKINNNDLLVGGTSLFDTDNSSITTDSLESFFIKQLDVLKQTTNLISENKQQVIDVRLSMDGDIDLSLNNLPMNNMSQDMLLSLMNNPDFKNKILQIVNKSNNFYS